MVRKAESCLRIAFVSIQTVHAREVIGSAGRRQTDMNSRSGIRTPHRQKPKLCRSVVHVVSAQPDRRFRATDRQITATGSATSPRSPLLYRHTHQPPRSQVRAADQMTLKGIGERERRRRHQKETAIRTARPKQHSPVRHGTARRVAPPRPDGEALIHIRYTPAPQLRAVTDRQEDNRAPSSPAFRATVLRMTLTISSRTRRRRTDEIGLRRRTVALDRAPMWQTAWPSCQHEPAEASWNTAASFPSISAGSQADCRGNSSP